MEDKKKDEKEYYIIYFDILGYKQYFEENEENQQLLHYIIHMIDDVEKRVGIYEKINKSKLKVKAFSDNLIIGLETDKLLDPEDYLIMGFVAANIQATILRKYGLLIRGGFTKGKFYINENIVYGKGLIRAVQLESIAKYPRILVDKETIKKENWEKFTADIIVEDHDGEYYLNYFDKRHIERILPKLKEKVVEKIKKDGKYNPTVKDENKIKVYESIIQKTLWVVEKFNEACDAIGKPEEKIDYKVTINKRLLKMELSLAEKA